MAKFFRTIWAVTIAAGLFFFQLAINGCSSDQDITVARPDTIAQKIPKPGLYKIEISHMKFEPAELKVKKGDKVVFVNNDMVTHDVTEEKNKSWTSSPLKPGEYWTLTVTESDGYFCNLHPVMKGKIVSE